MLRFPTPPPADPAAVPGWLAQAVPLLSQAIDGLERSADQQDIVVARRLAPYRGAELVAADVATGGGGTWGGAGLVVAFAAGSTDVRGRVTITCGAAPGANPVWTLTFRDGAWRQAPFGIVAMNGGTGAQLVPTWTLTATTLAVTFPGTPVAGLTYVFEYLLLG